VIRDSKAAAESKVSAAFSAVATTIQFFQAAAPIHERRE